MTKGLVIYHSKSGNTKQMAEAIAAAMNEAGLETAIKPAAEATNADLLGADAIVIGSPTYYGQMAGTIKHLMDDAVARHGRLDGKIGAAFTSSANIGGGNETTLLGILQAMLVHGMVIQGDPKGDHYGPVSIGRPDERALAQCQQKGKRVAELAFRMFGAGTSK